MNKIEDGLREIIVKFVENGYLETNLI